VLKKENSLK